jgi:type II secretory pathway component PulF
MQWLRGFPLKKKTVFFRQLSTMISSGLSLSRAVATAGIGTQPLSQQMSQNIVSGNSLAQCLARYPYLFSEYEIALIDTGENSGSLDTQLKVLADELEQTYRLMQTLSAKMLYPIFVAHFAVFIPPLVLLVRDGPGAYFRLTLGTIIPIYLIVAVLATLYRLGSSTGTFRYLIDTTLAWVPVLGEVLKLLALTRFVRALAHLVEAGTLPYHAYQVASRACGNSWVRSKLYTSYRRVGADARLSEWMQNTGMFSPTVLSLVASGEETGQQGPMVAKGAEILEMEYHAKVNLIMTLLPVLMLLGVGLLVGFRVYRLMMDTYAPLFQM